MESGDTRVMKLLLVEDEDAIAEPLAEGLRREGFAVDRVATGLAALEAPEPDLVLLDVGLPDTDGFAVCRELRSRSGVPIIILTAKGEEIDRVVGLEVGADDYIVKPFGFRELIARIRAVSRRTGERPTQQRREAGAARARHARPPRLRRGRGDRPHPEGVRPARAARERPGCRRSRGRGSSQEVWQTTWYGSAKTIDVHVAALRKKLGDPSWIETVRGVGLRLHVPDVSRRFLATYVALAVVVLAALEIPLGIQYGRSERRDLTGRIERDALTMATFAEGTLERGLDDASGVARPGGEALPAEPGRPRRGRRPHRAGAARHEPAAARAALVREPAGDRLRAPGEHRLRDAATRTRSAPT